MQERAKLGPVQLRLTFQTPEVYSTDIHQPTKPPGMFKYGCKMPPKETYKNGLGEPMPRHPSFILNSPVKQVHVHLEDTKTGQVFWDADFKTSKVLFSSDKRQVSSFAKPLNFDPKTGKGVFRAPCVEADDPEPHDFLLSIQGTDGVFDDDNATSWGEWQGLDKMDGPRGRAFIGFYVRRQPVLEETTLQEPSLISGGPYRKRFEGVGVPQGRQVKELLGQWRPGNEYGGEVNIDPVDRWNRGEQGLNMPQKAGLPPKDDRLYYDYTYKRKNRDWSYWTWLGGPNLQNTPMEMDFSDILS